jgi:tetratricopeptide (TPR) repeat protein
VLRNPWIKDLRFLPEIFSRNVWSFLRNHPGSNYYRPLMHVVYMAEYHVFGLKAWGFHLVNALLHVVNSLLVLIVAARLAPGPGIPGRGRMAFLLSFPFVAAVLFATHPVHVEAVAWIASVPELTFTGLVLAAFLLYVSAGERRDPVLVFGSVLLFFLALLCKETAVTLPALLIAYDLALRPRTRPWAGRLAIYSLFAAAAAVYLVLRHHVMQATLLPYRRSWNLSVYELGLNALVLLRTYLQKLLLPVHLEFWHSFRPISSVLTIEGLSAFVVTVLVVLAAAVTWRKDRPSFFFLALIVVPLAPAFYINALPFKPFAERYLYLPSVGFVLLAARGLELLARSGRRRTAIALVLVTTALYSAGTIARNRVWKSAYTLFVDTVSKSPDALIPRYDLAVALWKLGRVDEAAAEYRTLIDADPSDARYHLGLASALIAMGCVDEAIAELTAARGLDPSSTETLTDLGVAMKRKGDSAAAAAFYRQALDLDPEYPDAHFDLAGALADEGRTDEALEHYQKAVDLNPDNAFWRAALGIERARAGRLDEAIAQFEEAVRLDAGEPAYRQDLEHARALRAAPPSPGDARPRT